MLFDTERARTLMEREGYDAIVAGSPENFHYCSNFADPYIHVVRSNLAFAVIQYDGPPVLIVSHVQKDIARRESWIEEQVYYDSEIYIERTKPVKTHATAPKALATVIHEHGLSGGAVGIDKRELLVPQYKRIRRSLPDIDLMDCSDLFVELRRLKSDEEINRLRIAAEATEAGIRAFLENVEAGVSERDLEREVQQAIVDSGAIFSPHHPGVLTLGGGENSANGLAQPTDYQLRDGDVARIDIGAIYEGYTSDIARVTTVGDPSSRVKNYYNAIRKAQQRVIDHIEPGAKLSELFQIGQEVVREAGFTDFTRGHIGHSIGMHHHEPPLLASSSDGCLEPGMVLTVEVPLHVEGFAGFNVEDVCLVTENGHEVFGNLGYQL